MKNYVIFLDWYLLSFSFSMFWCLKMCKMCISDCICNFPRLLITSTYCNRNGSLEFHILKEELIPEVDCFIKKEIKKIEPITLWIGLFLGFGRHKMFIWVTSKIKQCQYVEILSVCEDILENIETFFSQGAINALCCQPILLLPFLYEST